MSDAFHPDQAGTVNINVSSGTQRVLLSQDGSAVSVRIMNDGTATVWVNYGDVTVTASTSTGFPVGSGVTEVLTFNNTGNGPLYVAVIAAASSGRIYFTTGVGF